MYIGNKGKVVIINWGMKPRVDVVHIYYKGESYLAIFYALICASYACIYVWFIFCQTSWHSYVHYKNLDVYYTNFGHVPCTRIFPICQSATVLCQMVAQ